MNYSVSFKIKESSCFNILLSSIRLNFHLRLRQHIGVEIIIPLKMIIASLCSSLDVPSRHSSSGSLRRWRETSFKYSLNETEKPNRSTETFLMSALAYRENISDCLNTELEISTWSSLTLSPRQRNTFWVSLKLRIPSLS